MPVPMKTRVPPKDRGHVTQGAHLFTLVAGFLIQRMLVTYPGKHNEIIVESDPSSYENASIEANDNN